MQITKPKIKLRNYPEAYQQISAKLDALCMSEIGDPHYRENQGNRFKDKNGEMRSGSVDLSRDGRVSRTCQIMKLLTEQIDRLHAAEKKKGYFISQIKLSFKQEYKSKSLNDKHIESICEFQQNHRPEPEQFHGVSIPAYFPPDNEFDGLEYHHAWDKSAHAYQTEFNQLDFKSKNKAGLDD